MNKLIKHNFSEIYIYILRTLNILICKITVKKIHILHNRTNKNTMQQKLLERCMWNNDVEFNILTKNLNQYLNEYWKYTL